MKENPNVICNDCGYCKQNKQLKELLKECRDIAEFTKTIVNKHKWLDGVIAKINQALGEE